MLNVLIDSDVANLYEGFADDSLAIIYARLRGQISVKAISVVFNCEHSKFNEKTNAVGFINEVLGRQVPFAGGFEKPISEVDTKIKPKAINLMVETIKANDKISLVCIGPLTNIAFLVNNYPELKETIRELVVMGGAFDIGGNLTPFAEYNIGSDPIAAKTVFDSKMPITLVPLDVTENILLSKKQLYEIKCAGTNVSDFVFKICAKHFKSYPKLVFNDPITIEMVANRSFAETVNGRVDVEVCGKKAGRTVFVEGQGNVSRVTGIKEKVFLENFFKVF